MKNDIVKNAIIMVLAFFVLSSPPLFAANSSGSGFSGRSGSSSGKSSSSNASTRFKVPRIPTNNNAGGGYSIPEGTSTKSTISNHPVHNCRDHQHWNASVNCCVCDTGWDPEPDRGDCVQMPECGSSLTYECSRAGADYNCRDHIVRNETITFEDGNWACQCPPNTMLMAGDDTRPGSPTFYCAPIRQCPDGQVLSYDFQTRNYRCLQPGSLGVQCEVAGVGGNRYASPDVGNSLRRCGPNSIVRAMGMTISEPLADGLTTIEDGAQRFMCYPRIDRCMGTGDSK